VGDAKSFAPPTPAVAFAVASVVLIVVVLLLAWWVWSIVRRHRVTLIPRRGMSVGADLGVLEAQERVHVRSVRQEGPDRVHLVLAPEAGGDDLDMVVFLREDEFGFDLLHEWRRSGASIAIVIPPGSRIVRLRSVDDLQPLTLSRVVED
jgi:hypothetical protein